MKLRFAVIAKIVLNVCTLTTVQMTGNFSLFATKNLTRHDRNLNIATKS